MQSVNKLCANIDTKTKTLPVALLELLSWLKQTVQVYTKPVYCTIVHKTSLWYKCTQNQLMVQVYTKPVYSTSVHKTSLLYKCTQNQFTVQVYTKSVYCTSLHKTSLLVNNERNVHGQNNSKECTGTEHY